MLFRVVSRSHMWLFKLVKIKLKIQIFSYTRHISSLRASGWLPGNKRCWTLSSSPNVLLDSTVWDSWLQSDNLACSSSKLLTSYFSDNALFIWPSPPPHIGLIGNSCWWWWGSEARSCSIPLHRTSRHSRYECHFSAVWACLSVCLQPAFMSYSENTLALGWSPLASLVRPQLQNEGGTLKYSHMG